MQICPQKIEQISNFARMIKRKNIFFIAQFSYVFKNSQSKSYLISLCQFHPKRKKKLNFSWFIALKKFLTKNAIFKSTKFSFHNFYFTIFFFIILFFFILLLTIPRPWHWRRWNHTELVTFLCSSVCINSIDASMFLSLLHADVELLDRFVQFEDRDKLKIMNESCTLIYCKFDWFEIILMSHAMDDRDRCWILQTVPAITRLHFLLLFCADCFNVLMTIAQCKAFNL